MRINYGQNVDISGLAGAVSLCGSGGGLWSVEGGNWQMAAGLIEQENVSLHLNKEVASISLMGEKYEVNSTDGKLIIVKLWLWLHLWMRSKSDLFHPSQFQSDIFTTHIQHLSGVS